MLTVALVRSVVVSVSCSLLLASTSGGVTRAAESELQQLDAAGKPLMLDISKYYFKPSTGLPHFKSFCGLQFVDGLPFQIDGQARLYGKTSAGRGMVYPDSATEIRVGRKFDELYLIHHTTWPDVQGETIAYISLNYADGSKYIFPIRYGFHVRDWFNLPSYEKERMADPDTTICWRRPPVIFKAPIRIFKSRFANPLHDKVVNTMDVVSARNLASYNLLAATVVDSNGSKRVELAEDRDFDAKVTIRVVDDTTGKPIEKALVLPGMVVLGEGVVGSPFYTSSAGEGTVPYPTENTRRIWAQVKKQGFQSQSRHWTSPAPKVFTFRLKPVAEEKKLKVTAEREVETGS